MIRLPDGQVFFLQNNQRQVNCPTYIFAFFISIYTKSSQVEAVWCLLFIIINLLENEKLGWPTAILFLAPAEGWKGPSGPAGNLWPHLK